MAAVRKGSANWRRRAPTVALRLYVAGSSPNSLEARANLKVIEGRLGARFELELVDVLANPGRALSDGILVTPTLVRVSPWPSIRILGNLRDIELVLRTLGLA